MVTLLSNAPKGRGRGVPGQEQRLDLVLGRSEGLSPNPSTGRRQHGPFSVPGGGPRGPCAHRVSVPWCFLSCHLRAAGHAQAATENLALVLWETSSRCVPCPATRVSPSRLATLAKWAGMPGPPRPEGRLCVGTARALGF